MTILFRPRIQSLSRLAMGVERRGALSFSVRPVGDRGAEGAHSARRICPPCNSRSELQERGSICAHFRSAFPARAKSGHFASVQVTARATSGSSRIKRHLGDADGGKYRKQGAKYQAERKFFPAHSLRSGVMFWLFTPYVASHASGRK